MYVYTVTFINTSGLRRSFAWLIIWYVQSDSSCTTRICLCHRHSVLHSFCSLASDLSVFITKVGTVIRWTSEICSTFTSFRAVDRRPVTSDCITKWITNQMCEWLADYMGDLIISSLFWLFMQLFLAVCRSFGRAYRFLLQGSNSEREVIAWL